MHNLCSFNHATYSLSLWGSHSSWERLSDSLWVGFKLLCHLDISIIYCDAVVKNPSANAGDTGDVGLIPGSGRSPEVGNTLACQSRIFSGKFWEAWLVGYCPWCHKELDATEQAHALFIVCITVLKGLLMLCFNQHVETVFAFDIFVILSDDAQDLLFNNNFFLLIFWFSSSWVLFAIWLFKIKHFVLRSLFITHAVTRTNVELSCPLYSVYYKQ